MKILFCSDLGFRGLESYLGDQAVRGIFAELMPVIDQADHRVVNLETPFVNGSAPIVKSGPNIFSLTEYVYALHALKIDAVGLANNHTGDYGADGVCYTLDTLKAHGFATFGAGRDLEEAYRPHLFEKDGVRVAVFGICENEFGIAEKNVPGSAGYRLGLTYQGICREKAKGNRVVIYFHGGNENDPYPSPGKQELYRFFLDCGADAVVAMHTHCPQGWEIYKEKPIVYSMGNFFFTRAPQNMPPDPNSAYYYGYMTMLDFSRDKVTPTLYPYHFTLEKMELLKGRRLEGFMQYLDQICQPIHDPELLQKYFEGWCRIGGAAYVKKCNFTPEMCTSQERIRHLKNNYSCEAHNEVVEAYLKLCYDGGLERAEEYERRIREKTTIVID